MMHSFLLAIAIVAHEPGYYTSMANHVKRWLGQENVPAQVVSAQAMAGALQKERLAFLVGFENPTAGEMSTLRAFRARGGKLVVLYSGSAALGALMGVQPVGYSAAPYPGAWSRMDFASKIPAGLPRSVRQTSSVLQRARPEPGKGRVLATWSDRQGRSTGEPAWIVTGAGYWMTHLLLSDGDEDAKAQLLGAIVGSVDPKAWSLTAHTAREAAKQRAWRDYAMRQVPRRGEIHAVWDHEGTGLYPGDWPRTFRILQDAHVTDLFVNVAGAGFAHYPSTVLPRSKTFWQEGDQLAKCLAAAKGTGIRVHAWVLTFTATRGSPNALANFAKKGWRLKTTGGKMTDYLNPSIPAVRSYMLSAIDEIVARYPVAGIHLDFIRWGDGIAKPANAAVPVSQFVTAARQRVKRPRWLTTAVYGKYPQCVASVGQNWASWLDASLVDYVVPMDYTSSLQTLNELLAMQSGTQLRRQRTIIGLGVTANESHLDAKQVIDQINLTRRYGFAGNALFDLDTTLERNVLPYLRLGLW